MRCARTNARMPSCMHSSPPVEHDPDVEVLGRLGVELLGERERGRRRPRRCRWRPGRRRRARCRPAGRRRRGGPGWGGAGAPRPAGVDAGHPRAERSGSRSASDQNRIRNGPERERRARAASRASRRARRGPKTAPAARGVVVGAEDQARAGASGRGPGETTFCEARRKKSRAQQVEAGVEVEVHRDARRRSTIAKPTAGQRSRPGCRRTPSAQWSGVDERRTAGARRSARPRPGGRCSRSRSASQFAARRSASVPAQPCPRTSTARESAPWRPAASTGGGLSRAGRARSCSSHASGPMRRSMSATDSRRATEIVHAVHLPPLDSERGRSTRRRGPGCRPSRLQNW